MDFIMSIVDKLFGITLTTLALYVFGAISAITLLLYMIDKIKAKLGAWRIPEKTLLLLSFLGGGVGGALGMFLFRHKIRHWYFVLINTLGVLLQAGTLYYLYFVLKIGF